MSETVDFSQAITTVLIVASLLILGYVFFGSNYGSSEDTETLDSSSQPTDELTPQTKENTKTYEANYFFNGSRDTVTGPVYLSGFYLMDAVYMGDSNFMVFTIDESGEESLIFNEISAYEGTTSGTFQPGHYRFKISLGTNYAGGTFSTKANWALSIHS